MSGCRRSVAADQVGERQVGGSLVRDIVREALLVLRTSQMVPLIVAVTAVAVVGLIALLALDMALEGPVASVFMAVFLAADLLPFVDLAPHTTVGDDHVSARPTAGFVGDVLVPLYLWLTAGLRLIEVVLRRGPVTPPRLRRRLLVWLGPIAALGALATAVWAMTGSAPLGALALVAGIALVPVAYSVIVSTAIDRGVLRLDEPPGVMPG